jgi:hypothetical protein
MDVLIDKVVVLYRTVLMTYVFLFFDPKAYNYLAFQSFDYERTGWRLFQKRFVHTKFDIYISMTITGSIPLRMNY